MKCVMCSHGYACMCSNVYVHDIVVCACVCIIYIILYIYVAVTGRKRTLFRTRLFEKMAT